VAVKNLPVMLPGALLQVPLGNPGQRVRLEQPRPLVRVHPPPAADDQAHLSEPVIRCRLRVERVRRVPVLTVGGRVAGLPAAGRQFARVAERGGSTSAFRGQCGLDWAGHWAGCRALACTKHSTKCAGVRSSLQPAFRWYSARFRSDVRIRWASLCYSGLVQSQYCPPPRAP
jgi:hypothetical protein